MNKQIEEMAKVIINAKNDVKVWERLKTDEDIAEALYNAGYRKQSRGEWKKIDGFPKHRFCTRCGKGNRTQPNFCPNCGARMKGGAE